jgi:hypothetical protein
VELTLLQPEALGEALLLREGCRPEGELLLLWELRPLAEGEPLKEELPQALLLPLSGCTLLLTERLLQLLPVALLLPLLLPLGLMLPLALAPLALALALWHTLLLAVPLPGPVSEGSRLALALPLLLPVAQEVPEALAVALGSPLRLTLPVPGARLPLTVWLPEGEAEAPPARLPLTLALPLRVA